ncbi:STAS domain-containing protein [Actinoplanes sp. M2I2]|uniref:STAS domain-containing protein n=1 Tax=Actinoplanes sp. M2I2 TaxID=1734444 RepID=UPI002020388A|nr:STAS domain-containing protein [Actinoplanes sp. M2I2]
MTGPDGRVLIEISRHTEHPDGVQHLPVAVIDVAGEIDAETAPVLRTALTQAIRHNRRVCCDLSRVAFLGADGANTIFGAVRSADDTGCAFSVRGVHGISALVFQITGLAAVLAGRA